MKKTTMLLFSMLILIPLVFAQTGLQKINVYNQQQAVFYLQNLSFFVAFVSGMISVLLPCTLAILPAFFAYTFKERKEITKMTLVFFAGFSMIFIVLGIFAAAIGETLTSIQILQTTKIVAGILLIASGLTFIVFNGTSVINNLDPLRTSVYAYIFEDRLFNIPYINLIGLAAFALFVAVVGYFIYKRGKEPPNSPL